MHAPNRTVVSPRRALVALAVALSAFVNGCGCTHRTTIAPRHESQYDIVHMASLDSAGTAHRTSFPLSPGAYRWIWWWNRGHATPRTPQAFAHIEPVLLQWLADSSSTKEDTLIISFRDPIRVPRFPDPDMTLAFGDSINGAALDSVGVKISTVTASRDSMYHADSLALANQYHATVLERFWIAQALKVVMPLGLVDSLSHRPDVVFIQRDRTDSPPPQGWDGNDDNDPIVARGMIVSDPYYNLGYSYGWVSLLDTGVRSTHRVFDPANSPFHRLGDCVDGSADCEGGTSTDVDVTGHGTPSAAILVANSTTWPRFRGVTAGKLDAFRVYDFPVGSARPKLRVSAALRGFQTATSMLDRVVVAEMQDNSPEAAAIGDAADNAYTSGATVIAANGNYVVSTANPLASPARSRRTIGVGAWDLMSQGIDPNGSFGRTADLRNKPDLLAPSSTESAGSASDDAHKYHGATSGATPYVAGGAMLLRNWLVWASGTTDPGQVHAQLILSGEIDGPYDQSGAAGAGMMKLPTNGWCYFGKVEIKDDYRECTIPIAIQWPDIKRIEAAIWWPEQLVVSGGAEVDTHNDLNITLFDQAGVEQKRSWSVNSVYEKCTAPVTTSSGVWTLKIDSASLKNLPQTVYWTVALRR